MTAPSSSRSSPYVSSAIRLRPCYAMSGTDIPNGVICYAMSGTDIPDSVSSLRALRAMSSTDVSYGFYTLVMQCPVRAYVLSAYGAVVLTPSAGACRAGDSGTILALSPAKLVRFGLNGLSEKDSGRLLRASCARFGTDFAHGPTLSAL
eukprot:1321869-Rhodomonas_salina.1